MDVIDYLLQPKIQEFLQENNTSKRFKSIVNDGCVIVHHALVLAASTRLNKSESAVRRKWPKLKLLATEAMKADEMKADESSGVRKMIVALANVRNAADHEPLTDNDIREQFFAAFQSVRGNAFDWRGSRKRDLQFAHIVFSWLLWEIARWQHGLPPVHKSS